MHKYEVKVFHADTDCYKVVWHGNYLRYLEQARCDFVKSHDKNLNGLEEEGILTPVINIEIKYKHAAVLYDDLVVETSVLEAKGIRLTFLQKILKKNTDILVIEAKVTCTLTNNEGKLLRKMPEQILKLCDN